MGELRGENSELAVEWNCRRVLASAATNSMKSSPADMLSFLFICTSGCTEGNVARSSDLNSRGVDSRGVDSGSGRQQLL